MSNPDVTQPTPKPQSTPPPGATPTGYERTTGGGGVRWEPPSAAELQALMPGYTIEKVLGRGGMGAVYRGVQTNLDRPVAIKILPPGVEKEDPSFAERFKSEARLMARLTNPAVVGVYDFGTNLGGQLYFAMEYVDGSDVSQMIRSQGKLSPEHALAITAHVCDALQAAHELGIVHRDIKPANILINMKGQVKVADFGLAKVEDPGSHGLTKTGYAMGTPDFVSPEALTLGTAIDGRADLYAVGVMLYQMLTGNIPRGAWQAASVLVPGLDPRFDAIITKAMQYDREHRYRDALEFRRALDVILTVPMVRNDTPAGAAVPAAQVAQAPGQRSVAQKPQGKPPQQRSEGSARAPLFIGLGAAAALALGAFMMMGGKKETMPGSPLAASGGANGGQPSSVPPKTAGTAASSSKPATEPPKPPASSVAKSSAPSNPTPQWRKTDFANLTKDAVGKNRLENGFLYVASYESWKPEPPGETWRNGAIRTTILWEGETKTTGTQMNIRENDQSSYFTRIYNTVLQVVFRKTGQGEPLLAKFPIEPPLQPNREVTVQMAAIGKIFIVWLNGRKLGSIEDERQNGPGRAYLKASAARFKNFEFINLDGVPEAEALRILGLDEKVNELRGTSVAAGVGAEGQAVSGATALETATKDKPFVNTLGMKFVPVPIGGGPTKGQQVLFSVWHTRVQDYAAYVKAQEAEGKKVDDSWMKQQKDGVPVGRETDHPVVGLSWEDAQAFCRWLTQKEISEGKLPNRLKYRLPTDEEWSWAVGLPAESGAKYRTNSVDFPWGKDFPPTIKVGNYADETFHAKFPKDFNDKGNDQPWIKDYTDGYATTSPVGSFPANAYGLHDMGGNVWQWCEDWKDENQKNRVLRGGSWGNEDRGSLLSSNRHLNTPATRNPTCGFRCVLSAASVTSTAAQSPSSSPSPPATKPSDKFPSGQWVKVLPDGAPIPSGAQRIDGWIVNSASQIDVLTRPLDRPLKNVAFRALIEKISADYNGNLGLRHYDRGGNSQFRALQMRLFSNSPAIIVQTHVNGAFVQNPLTQTTVDLPPKGVRALEFAAVGSRVFLRIDGHLAASAQDEKPQSGDIVLSQFRGKIRDIEIMNLDELPEVEALRLIGIDEKSNDLRAAAAKQEQQKAEMAKQADAMAATPELKALHEQFVKLQAERVNAPFDADVAKLKAGYLGGLERKMTELKQKGDLDGVLALEAEKKLISDKQPLPAEDDAKTTEALKDLRKIYRDAYAKLETTRDANLKLLTDPLDARLKQLESTLTQQNRIEHAKTVREYREGLGKEGRADTSARTSSNGGAAATMNEADKTARSSGGGALTAGYSPRVSREVAAQVISKGGRVRYEGSENWVVNVEALPRSGRLEGIAVTGAAVTNITDADLQIWSQAKEVKILKIDSDNVPDAVLRITSLKPLRTWTGLTSIQLGSFNSIAIPSTEFAVFRDWKSLNEVVINNLQVDRGALEAICSSPVLTGRLSLNRMKVFNEYADVVGKAIGVRTLALSFLTDLNDEGIGHFAGLARLEDFSLTGSPQVTDSGLRRLHPDLAVTLKRLRLEAMSADLARADGLGEAVAERFRGLENIEMLAPLSPGVYGKIAGLPKLRTVFFRNPGLGEEHLQALSASPSIEALKIRSGNVEPDQWLALKQIRSLRTLALAVDEYGKAAKDAARLKLNDEHLAALIELRQIERLIIPAEDFSQQAIDRFQSRRRDCRLELLK